jgi:hypothetical protein
LGPEALAQLQKNIDEAQAYHQRPIPTEIIANFKVPSTAFDYCRLRTAHGPKLKEGYPFFLLSGAAGLVGSDTSRVTP